MLLIVLILVVVLSLLSINRFLSERAVGCVCGSLSRAGRIRLLIVSVLKSYRFTLRLSVLTCVLSGALICVPVRTLISIIVVWLISVSIISLICVMSGISVVSVSVL